MSALGAAHTSAPAQSAADPALLFGAERAVPSTAAQRALFKAARTDPEALRAGIHVLSITLRGALDLDALYSALHALIERHEALRGRYAPDGERFIVRERIAFEVPVVDLRGAAPAEAAARDQALRDAECTWPYDLVEGPLVRASLILHDADRAVLVFSCHHAVVDGWSLNAILDELPRLYTALAGAGQPAPLPPVASFVDYVLMAGRRETQNAATVRRYWRGVYADGAPILELPLDRPRPRRRDLAARRRDHRVGPAIVQGLKQAGARGGASQFIGLLAAYAIYLARICGQDDLVIGVPAAGQIGSGNAGLVGHDTRVLPLRCRVLPGDSYQEVAGRLMDQFLAAYEHQWIALPDLVADLDLPVDAARVPLASVAFSFDPGMRAEAFRFPGLEARHDLEPRRFDAYEMAINAVLEGDELLLECTYSSSLFEDDTIAARLAQFEQLMAAIVAGPEQPVERLRVVPADQVLAMERELNATAMDFERDLCVDALVERSVRAAPAKAAVESPDTVVSYAQLWEQSGRVASAVLAAGLGPRPLVGVMLERGAGMVAVLLGVWRAGGAFVPLDPAFPPERLQYMVDHSRIGLLLTQGALRGAPAITGVQRLDLTDLARFAPVPPPPPAPRAAGDVAYVLYTSGSTGQPKGVQIRHRALHNFLCTMLTRAPGMTAEDRLLAVTTLSFDIAQLELWLPLVAGATTVIIDRATAMDGRAIAAVMRERRISFLQATPTTWRLLLFGGWTGNRHLTALCGGEALPRELADELLPRVGALWNVYGPTETTVWSTIDRVDESAAAGGITIGRPIGNTRAYVVDAQGEWVPRGSAGELWLGGEGVALGYLGRDDLTAERFLPDRHAGTGRLYRTGDLVRLRRDGRLEFIGRNDFQVKINGYRIELPEVQQALARVPAIAQCVVVGKSKNGGEAVLVAYFTVRPGTSTSAPELRAALRSALPDYMVPGVFHQLVQLPLTQNGKIDVKALPDPFGQPRRAGTA